MRVSSLSLLSCLFCQMSFGCLCLFLLSCFVGFVSVVFVFLSTSSFLVADCCCWHICCFCCLVSWVSCRLLLCSCLHLLFWLLIVDCCCCCLLLLLLLLLAYFCHFLVFSAKSLWFLYSQIKSKYFTPSPLDILPTRASKNKYSPGFMMDKVSLNPLILTLTTPTLTLTPA
jgi:hypothetical protein